MRAFFLPSAAILLLVLAGCATPPGASTPPAAAPGPYNVLGREDAPVTMIEFTDLQCPYCARYAMQTFPRLKREYIDTGKLRYTSRDLPLPMHAHAMPAAVASRCAGEQGHFWEFRDAVFHAQATLPSAPYATIAGGLGLDVERFEACRMQAAPLDAVRADLEIARSHGIGSTPTFVVGRMVNGQFEGEIITGAQPYELFAAKIDALLAAPR